jgi:hypothetical protein
MNQKTDLKTMNNLTIAVRRRNKRMFLRTLIKLNGKIWQIPVNQLAKRMNSMWWEWVADDQKRDPFKGKYNQRKEVK